MLKKTNLHAARHKAAKQQGQSTKLFSDVAIGAFRCDNRRTKRLVHSGLDVVSAQKLAYTMSDTSAG